MDQRFFSQMKAYFFDLDGCLYFTDQAAAGARKLLELLLEKGKQVCFVTNNSRQTAEEIAIKMNNMDLPVVPEQIITATECAGKYIKEKWGKATVKVVGSQSLERSLELAGHRVCALNGLETADVIVMGRDTEFTYEKLELTVREERKGAQVVSVNPDLFHPGRHGERVPETGALVAAVEAIIGRKVVYIGKPAPYLFQYGMNLCHVRPGECVMIGDNLKTDILGGQEAGMRTIWIRGQEEAPREENELNPIPDYSVANIEELLTHCMKSLCVKS